MVDEFEDAPAETSAEVVPADTLADTDGGGGLYDTADDETAGGGGLYDTADDAVDADDDGGGGGGDFFGARLRSPACICMAKKVEETCLRVQHACAACGEMRKVVCVAAAMGDEFDSIGAPVGESEEKEAAV